MYEYAKSNLKTFKDQQCFLGNLQSIEFPQKNNSGTFSGFQESLATTTMLFLVIFSKSCIQKHQ